ncbi:MAG TPA: hypothetical protein VEU07_00560 [Candidatus Acidoferrum sp.]|nr:hypothetical protein [Candidatus Acidoferrum sp.]
MGIKAARSIPRGLTILEVLLAAVILTVGLLGVLGVFPTGYTDMVASGSQSKATAYAAQKIEELRNEVFGTMANGNDNLEGTQYARNWTVQFSGLPGNRLARIAVTVDSAGRGGRRQIVTLETLRAE